MTGKFKNLWQAVKRNNLADVQECLAAGEDAGIREKRGDNKAMLHLAQTPEIIDALLAAGANPNAKDDNDCTPLHDARNAEITRLLLVAGADPHAKDCFGCTPLHHARDEAMAQALIAAGADPLSRDNDGNLPEETQVAVREVIAAGGGIIMR